MNKGLLIMAKKMNACSELLARKSTLIAASFALSLAFINGNPVQAATFRYTIAQSETLYKEDKTILNGVEYDGSFINSVFDPVTNVTNDMFGFFSIISGSLGKAMAVEAVQKSPVDRTTLGDLWTVQAEYLATPEAVTKVPGAVTQPPGLTEFDFKFVPSKASGEPTVLSKGWSAEKVPEPSAILSLGVFSGLLLLKKKKIASQTKLRSNNISLS